MQETTDLTQSEWISPAEAAALLGVSTKTLLRIAVSGDVENIKLPSGHRRYLKSSVTALAAGNTQ